MIMNTKKWLKTSMLALLLGSLSFSALATAEVRKTGTLAGTCSGGCIDTWKVECKDGNTKHLLAVVNDNGAEDVVFEITTMGYTGGSTLVGQAQQARNVEFSPYHSNGASISRPGTTTGSINAFVLVHVHGAHSFAPFPYVVEFSCHDINYGDLKEPVVKLLQDK
jgi:hypothetical protein